VARHRAFTPCQRLNQQLQQSLGQGGPSADGQQLADSEQLVQQALEKAQAAQEAAQQAAQQAQAAATVLESRAKDHAWRQGSSGGAGRVREAAAEVRSQIMSTATRSEEDIAEMDRRREQSMHLRVVVKAGRAPAQGDGHATFQAILLERLGMSEECVERVMSAVSQVRVLFKKAGAGFTLLVILTSPYAKAEVIRQRNKWRDNGSSGPALAIGHNLTTAQREAHAKLFPVMRSLYDGGLRQVEMVYYPAVQLRVCGQLYSNAAAATRAGEAALQKFQITSAGNRGTSAGAGAGTERP
jgi:hypothetical protein